MGMIRGLDLNAVLVSPGEHLIEASTTDGVATIRTKVEVGPGEKTVVIKLQDQIDLQSKMQAERLREQSGDDPGSSRHIQFNGLDADWRRHRNPPGNTAGSVGDAVLRSLSHP